MAITPGPGPAEALEPLRVCFVCSGNICRSPMAEIVLARMVLEAGLDEWVEVDSAGTGDWHIGERADRRTVEALAAAGYSGDLHRARQFEPEMFAARDYVVGLDRGHVRTLRSWARNGADREKVVLLRRFEPGADRLPEATDLDIPDPYYDGLEAFESVLRQIEAACTGLLDHLGRRLSEAGLDLGAEAGAGAPGLGERR